MKRLTVFLLVILLLLISPIAILADLPENDLDSYYHLDTIEIVFDNSLVTSDFSLPLSFGVLYNFALFYASLDTPSDRTFGLVFSMDLDLSSVSDLYFLQNITSELGQQPNLVLLDVLSNDTGESVSFDQSLSSSFLFSGSYNYYNFSYEETSIFLNGSGSASTTRELFFTKLSDVPPGSYSFLFYCDIFDIKSFNLPVAFFVDNSTSGSNSPGLSGDPILDFESGFISFQQAADEVRDSMNQILSDPESSDFEKQISIQIADSQLEQLQSISDAKFSQIVDDFDSNSVDIIESFITSGSTDFSDSLSDLNLLYTDSLTQATSPEQGILINTQYSLRLQQMQTIFDVNYKNELDNVLSDSDLQDKQDSYDRVDELLDIEDSARSVFEESNYQSYLTFHNWLLEFDDDPTVYRSIFEFLFEDPRSKVVQPYLVIPFSLVIVGVLLATTTVVFRGGKNG